MASRAKPAKQVRRKRAKRRSVRKRDPRLGHALDLLTQGHSAQLPSKLAAAAMEAFAAARRWLGHVSIQGLGIGPRIVQGRDTGEYVLKVYVDRKLPLDKVAHPVPRSVRVPGMKSEIEIDVEEIGRIVPEALEPEAPSRPGDAIGDADASFGSGTLGCVVRKRGEPGALYVLSNSHVIAKYGLAVPGAPVLRLGADPKVRPLENAFADYTESIPFTFSSDGFYNFADAAIARARSPEQLDATIPNIGAPKGINPLVRVGDRVRAVGARSGYGEGFVKDTDFRFWLNYLRAPGVVGRVGFRDQVLCTSYSQEGDSGAAVLNADSELVGLHFAGTNDGNALCSVFSPIGRILSALEIEPVTEGAGRALLDATVRISSVDARIKNALPILTQPHQYRASISWQLTPNGVKVAGEVEMTSGEPTTVKRVWETWGDSIQRWAEHFKVPAELIIATICTETSGNPQSVRIEPGYVSDEQTPAKVSPGLMQTLISTARSALGNPTIDRGWLLVPDHSIQAGTAYISEQRNLTGLDPPKVACAYNAGGIYPNDSNTNRWRMRQYPIGSAEHADRFIRWFNDCFRLFGSRNDAPAMSLFAALR